ncbi:MAG TPA: hypothetical protein DCS93_24520 [Microscillaceae bacterium]|nr:hypothetical protein [Microscillaceae bacterium]
MKRFSIFLNFIGYVPQQVRKVDTQYFITLLAGVVFLAVMLIIRPFGIRYQLQDVDFQWLWVWYALAISGVLLLNEQVIKALIIQRLKIMHWGILQKVGWHFYQSTLLFLVCWLIFLQSSFALILTPGWQSILTGASIIIFIVVPITEGTQVLQRKLKECYTSKTLKIKASDQSGGFEVSIPHLYFISSEDNYVAIHYWNTQQKRLCKTLVRTTLTKVTKQLASYGIVPCHRSFLINQQHITSIQGNKKQMKITLEKVDQAIPVSRKYAGVFALLKTTL